MKHFILALYIYKLHALGENKIIDFQSRIVQQSDLKLNITRYFTTVIIKLFSVVLQCIGNIDPL